MTEDKKRMIIEAAIGVVLITVVAVYFMYAKKESAPSEQPPQNAETSTPAQTEGLATPSVTPSSPTGVKKPVAKPTAPPENIDYQTALTTYRTSGYLFQFTDCRGTPGSLMMKVGTKFMMDNRDGKARKIAINGIKTYSVGAYDFVIAVAPSKAGLYYITCDGGGAAQINVQN
jgi:hypothetical protein